jgi:hypothetical protein
MSCYVHPVSFPVGILPLRLKRLEGDFFNRKTGLLTTTQALNSFAGVVRSTSRSVIASVSMATLTAVVWLWKQDVGLLLRCYKVQVTLLTDRLQRTSIKSWLHKSIGLSRWDASSCSATLYCSTILWKPDLQCRDHKSLSLVPVLSQTIQLHTNLPCLGPNVLLSVHPILGLSTDHFPSDIPTKILHAIFSSIRATCLVRVILFDLIVQVIFVGEYHLWSWRLPSYGMLRRVAPVRTDVSEERSASIKRTIRFGELGTTLAVTSNRRTLRRNAMYF